MTGANDDNGARSDLRTIVVVGVAHGVSHFYHLLFAPLFPWLMADFNLSFTQVGVLTTIFFIVSGTGQALAGFLVDRVGPLRVLIGGLATLALSACVLAAAGDYVMLGLAAALAGLGNSIFHPADFTILNRRVTPTRLGHAFAAHGLAGNLGWAAAPIFLAGLAAVSGWRMAAFCASLVGLAAVVMVLWQRRCLALEAMPEDERGVERRGGGASRFGFLRSPEVWLCFGFFFLVTMAAGAMTNFSPLAYGSLYGLSLAAGTSALSAYLFGGSFGVAAGGFAAARSRDHDRVVMAALALAAALAFLLATAWLPAWCVLPLMVLMGFGVGLAGPSRDLLIRRAATSAHGPAAYGRVYGFVYSGLDVGLACAPLLFGPLMDAGRYAFVIAGFGVLQVMAIVTVAVVGKRDRVAGRAAGA